MDLGVNGGFSWYSSMLGEDEHGVANQSVRFDSGWLVGSQFTIWPSTRVGIRANGTFTDRPMSSEGTTIHGNINLWTLTGDLMFRFREPNESWLGSEVLPYLALGLGVKFVNPAGDHFVCNDATATEVWSCLPYTVPPGTPGNPEFALGEENVLAGLVGIGADVRFAPNFSLRLELSDRIYRPRNYAAEFQGGNIWNLPQGDDNVSKMVHEIGGQAGLHLLLGLRRPEVVAVEPSPPPLPPPTPTPPPPPPPAEEEIMVCVVDPTAPGGLRMQSARFLPATGDTVVVQAGERVPLRQAVTEVPAAQTADWYVRGTPFVVEARPYRAEFVTYGTATMRQPGAVTFLGTVNGMPVFADADEVANIRTQLETRHQTTRDLTTIIGQDRMLRDEIDDIRTVYVPLRTVGCVFQPLQRLEPVRKGVKDLQ